MNKIILITLIVLLLPSCATMYKVEKCGVTEGILHCSKATITSRREFPDGVKIAYADGIFEFEANQVVSKESPLEQLGLDVARAALTELSKKGEK